jgi:hypothetical protein
MILGICLAVGSSRGHRLVVHAPKEPSMNLPQSWESVDPSIMGRMSLALGNERDLATPIPAQVSDILTHQIVSHTNELKEAWNSPSKSTFDGWTPMIPSTTELSTKQSETEVQEENLSKLAPVGPRSNPLTLATTTPDASFPSIHSSGKARPTRAASLHSVPATYRPAPLRKHARESTSVGAQSTSIPPDASTISSLSKLVIDAAHMSESGNETMNLESESLGETQFSSSPCIEVDPTLGTLGTPKESTPQCCVPSDLFGFNRNFLADMVCPKAICCDRRFDCQVGDRWFVGLPVALTGEQLAPRYGTMPGIAPYYQRRMARYMRSPETKRGSTPPPPEEPDWLTSDITVPRADPLGLRRGVATTPLTTSKDSFNSGPRSPLTFHINTFHVVFVVRDIGPETQDLVDALYTHVAVPLTHALRHEQLTEEYVRHQSELILGLMEGRFNSPESAQVLSTSSPLLPLPDVKREWDKMDLWHRIRHVSSLARLFDQLYEGISSQFHNYFTCMEGSSVPQPIHLTLNERIPLALQIPLRRVPRSKHVPYLEYVTPNPPIPDEWDPWGIVAEDHPRRFEFDAYPKPSGIGLEIIDEKSFNSPNPIHFPYDQFPSWILDDPCHWYHPLIRSYQSLVWLQEPGVILSSLPIDASPLIRQLLEWMRPSVSFAEAHVHLKVPLFQILRAVAHFIYWGKAKLIHPISLRNVYALNSKFPLHKYLTFENPVVQKIHLQCPGIDIVEFLYTVGAGPPRALSTLVTNREGRQSILEATAILMTHDILIQYHSYVYLKYGSLHHQTLNDTMYSVDPDSTIQVLKDWTGMTSTERDQVIQSLSTSVSNSLANLFLRVVPYLNGCYHADEIAYRAEISRRELRAVLATYATDLITVMHPAP